MKVEELQIGDFVYYQENPAIVRNIRNNNKIIIEILYTDGDTCYIPTQAYYVDYMLLTEDILIYNGFILNKEESIYTKYFEGLKISVKVIANCAQLVWVETEDGKYFIKIECFTVSKFQHIIRLFIRDIPISIPSIPRDIIELKADIANIENISKEKIVQYLKELKDLKININNM